ncbi:MAG: putative porin [Planctomycetes bacterium]|nr:putative porin [Planctomycetota bacterium]MBU1517885.1 putative porin [Planctomycetota bacterium]MBU2458322.1 putative porin [Planctomycetota bacterium]MBU2596171.1 putative porin [Planctomycetota bacterium]
MRKKVILTMCLFVLALGTDAKADELTELKEQIKILQQRIEKLEAKQNQQDAQMEKKIAKAVEEKQVDSLPDNIKWIERIQWGGDFRYRHESISDDTASTKRNRNRIRARLKMKAKVNDEWDAIFRIATGSSDSPTSTNHTLGDSSDDSFSSKELWLDWAYADYHPKWKPGLNILLGKMANPFYMVGGNQVIFDGDVSPEGGAAIYKWKMSDSTCAQLTGGAYWMRERSTGPDTSLFGIQGLVKHKLSDDSHILGGISYYDFGNINGQMLSGISSNGNTTSGGMYTSDYDMLEGFAEYGFKLGKAPASVFGTYVNNIAASTSGDTAWLIGTKYNKAKDPGTWEVSYDYRDVEKNAVVGGLCDSDFIGGGTDGKGHVVGFKYQLDENVQFGLNYFMNKKNVSSTKDDFRLIQADIMFKF